MKTLLLSEIFPPQHGGSGRWFWEIYTRILEDQMIFAVGEPAGYQEFDKSHNLRVHRFNFETPSWGITDLAGLSFYLRKFFEISKIAKTEGVNSIHCGRCQPEGFIAYLIHKLYSIPYICYIHGEDIETAALSRQLSWLAQKALNNSELLICNSKNTAQILRTKWHIPEGKITVIHPGVDTKTFRPAAVSNEKSLRPFDWGNRKVILTVGRLQKRKGHDKLIAALPKIIEKHPDTLYAIVGKGEEREHLEAEADRLDIANHVNFMDELSDNEMISCYQHCDLFVLPNRQVEQDIEGFGMVLVEAQACGKPVIAGNSGGTSETMIVGKSGFIIDCNKEDEISSSINSLFDNPKRLREMGANALNHAQSHFDWQNIAKQTQIAINKLASNSTKET